MRNIQINIFDNDLKWRGMLEEVESFVHRTSWNSILFSEMKISRTAAHIEEIKTGRILVINNRLDKALIIQEISFTIPDEFVELTLMPLKGILNYRVLVPEDSTNFISKPQAYVMGEIVKEQLVSQTRDPNRYFSKSTGEKLLMLEGISHSYGVNVDYFTNEWVDMYLGDLMEHISKMGLNSPYIGWNIFIQSDYSSIRFETYKATDRTINQNVVSPVVFSSEFGNIEKMDYFESIKDFRNFIYISYQDENENIFYTSQTNDKFGDVKSFDRREMLLDSNQETEASAQLDGSAELNKRPKFKSFSSEVIDNPNTLTTFEKDWFLGDMVTVQMEELGIQLNTQILEIEETYSSNVYSLNVTFSEGRPSVLKLIKNDFQLKRKPNY